MYANPVDCGLYRGFLAQKSINIINKYMFNFNQYLYRVQCVEPGNDCSK